MRKGNFNRFIDLAKKVHHDKYDYSITKEPNSVKDEIEVVCPLHGVFKTTFDSHVHSKAGCPKCSSKYVNLDSLIKSFKEANPDKKYSYEFHEDCKNCKSFVTCAGGCVREKVRSDKNYSCDDYSVCSDFLIKNYITSMYLQE